MLVKGLFDEYEKCLQDEPAATTARCPIHIDVPEFCAEMAQGNFKKAYAVLQKRMPFAGVFCLVCDAPCEEACVRGGLDAPVRMGALERAAVHYGRTPFKKRFKTSKLNGKVAVVGGGISGLSAAFDLDRRGYAVTLFEKGQRLGGWLWELVGDCLGPEDIEQELEAVSELAVEVRLGQPVNALQLTQLMQDYDAVFLGTGTWEAPLSVNPATFQAGSTKLFAGGSLAGTGDSVIDAVASGKRAAITIERLVKKISLTAEREREAPFETLLEKSLDFVEPKAAVEEGGGFLTQDEAQQEAARCLLCECDECIKACAHMQLYGRKPKTYAREIYTNENVVLGTRYANKMINSCTLCGLCGERCPIDLCMAPLVRQTRRSMVESGKMPASAHDFALRDMAFSNNAQCALVRQPPEYRKAEASCLCECTCQEEYSSASSPFSPSASAKKAPFLFFPGCQLAASEPEHIGPAYAWLRENLPEGVALGLGCCGAPADWAGRDDLLQETVDSFRTMWEAEGRPTLILACSSCNDVFSRFLSEIPLVSLWQVVARIGVPEAATRSAGAVLNIHDACTSRFDVELQSSVRTLVNGLGYNIEELRYSGEDTKCCGYGGLVFFANREQEADFAVDRARTSPHDLLVYCAMCKDLFIDAGKRSIHLLDLLFAEDVEEYALRRMPSLSERQANRAQLKRRLLREIWNEECPAPPPQLSGYTVGIGPDVLATMDERLILTSDVEDALSHALANPGERFYNTEDECYLICLRKQYVTYWVRYTQDEDSIEVLSAYSHRMDVVG